MLKIKIVNPTKCYVSGEIEEMLSLKRELTYKNTGIAFNIKKLKENIWLIRNKPDIFNLRLKELESKLTTTLLEHDSKGFFFKPGYLPYLKQKYQIIENLIDYPAPKKLPWKNPIPFNPYPYQKASVEGFIEQKHGVASLCTGGGKSLILLSLARELGLKTIVVTPSKSIFGEVSELFEHHLGKGLVGKYGDGKKKLDKKLTICISKSLTSIKSDSTEYEFFKSADVLIVDEAHLVGAETLEDMCHGLLKDIPYRFFLTGTPTRGDGSDKLLYSIIGQQISELSTKEAIDGGYICPTSFHIVKTFSPEKRNISDPLKCKRKHFLYNKNILDISANIANKAWLENQESTLILVEELKQIQEIAKRLKVPFGYAHSGSKADSEELGLEKVDIKQSVEDFNLGKTKVLIGTSCISTGTNIYPTHNTINLVAGSSEIKTKQGAIGRSVRWVKNEYKNLHKEKKIAKVWDFQLKDVQLLENQFQKRLKFYKEVTEDIEFYDIIG